VPEHKAPRQVPDPDVLVRRPDPVARFIPLVRVTRMMPASAKLGLKPRDARLFILGVMEKAMPTPRKDVSSYAPRIVTLHIKPDKIREVIGPGGKVIRGLVEQTGCKIDIEDDGTVLIASADGTAMEKAISMIQAITAEPEVGKIYDGVVRKIVEFGAFVEIMPGTDGLLHISQISSERIRRVEDVLHEGDEIKVKVLDVDRSGKIRLSMREAEQEPNKGN